MHQSLLRLVYVIQNVFSLCLFVISRLLSRPSPPVETFSVGYFHPYVDGAGGGERVLWCMIDSLARIPAKERKIKCVIVYCHNIPCSESYRDAYDQRVSDILETARSRFSLELNVVKADMVDKNVLEASNGSHSSQLPIFFVNLSSSWLLDPSVYPRLTMVGQSLGSILVGYEALRSFQPDIFFDTIGAAFTFPLARFVGCKVLAYVHYPTISMDMFPTITLPYSELFSLSTWKRFVFAYSKLQYYKLFRVLYRIVGHFASPGGVFVNSTWTQNHINSLWSPIRASLDSPVGPTSQLARSSVDISPNRLPSPQQCARILYPPCNVQELCDIPLPIANPGLPGGRELLVISISQFRPEKNQALQIRSFARFLDMNPDCSTDIKFCLIGGVRDSHDEKRMEELKALARSLRIEKKVDFLPNIPFPELKRLLGRAACGLHTMWNEHFGIGIVEMQAAGCIPIAHNSGGPKQDIVTPVVGVESIAIPTGFLADTEEGYAEAMWEVFHVIDHPQIARAARESSKRFSDEHFTESFLSLLGPFLR